jgi:hypothetical protein
MRSLAAVAGRKLSTVFTAPNGADALQGIGQRWPSVRSNDDRCRLGGLRSLAAVAGRKSTPFHGADGADALSGSASNGHPFAATMDLSPRVLFPFDEIFRNAGSVIFRWAFRKALEDD